MKTVEAYIAVEDGEVKWLKDAPDATLPGCIWRDLMSGNLHIMLLDPENPNLQLEED